MHENDDDISTALEELRAAVEANRADIDALQTQVRTGTIRADAHDVRADASEARADVAETSAMEHLEQSASDRRRIDELERQGAVDRQILAELQADGLLKSDKVEQLEAALVSSRRIGAAIGIVMTQCKVTDEQALAMLKAHSQHTNVKLRVLAEQIAETGDVTELEIPAADRLSGRGGGAN